MKCPPGCRSSVTRPPSHSHCVRLRVRNSRCCQSPSAAPSPQPSSVSAERSTPRFVGLYILLGSITSDPSIAHDDDSASFKSMSWLANEDKLQLPIVVRDADNTVQDDRTIGAIVQRYALGVLYFATKGDSRWSFASNWMSAQPTCEWKGVTCHSGVAEGNEPIDQISHLDLCKLNSLAKGSSEVFLPLRLVPHWESSSFDSYLKRGMVLLGHSRRKLVC